MDMAGISLTLNEAVKFDLKRAYQSTEQTQSFV